MVPPFEPSGQLPAGVFVATWQEITERFGMNAHHLRLLAGFLEAAQALETAGSRWILLNSSFVTSKELPNDIDACYDDEFLDYEMLELMEPALLEFSNTRAAQKARFGSEFFPARAIADRAGRTFQDFFQKDRHDQPKGIVKLELSSIPRPGGQP
jgi:hypothetical protein